MCDRFCRGQNGPPAQTYLVLLNPTVMTSEMTDVTQTTPAAEHLCKYELIRTITSVFNGGQSHGADKKKKRKSFLCNDQR